MFHGPRWTSSELGFQYSIYEGSADQDRHGRQPGHYSTLREPIMLKDVYEEQGRIKQL